MFDTEGFHSINSKHQGRRHERSPTRQLSNIHRVGFETYTGNVPIRKNRSSKKVGSMLQVKLKQKTTPPLIRVWMDSMQQFWKEMHPDKPTLHLSAGQFDNVMECFPNLTKESTVEVIDGTGEAIKITFSELVKQYLYSNSKSVEKAVQSRNTLSGMFSDLCRVLERAQVSRPMLESDTLGRSPANKIIEEYSFTKGPSRKDPTTKSSMYDELYEVYWKHVEAETDSLALLAKKAAEETQPRPVEVTRPPATLIERLNAQDCFSEGWHDLVNCEVANPPEEPSYKHSSELKEQDIIMSSIYELKRQTESMMKALQDKLMPF